MRKPILIVAAMLMLAPAAFSQDDKSDTWKRNWDAYVDEVIRCMKDSSCHLGHKFGGAVVTWDGTFEAVGSRILKDRSYEFKADEFTKGAQVAVRLRVNPRKIPIADTGIESDTPEVLEVEIKEGSLKLWQSIRKGAKVRFRITLASFGSDVGGLGRYGVSIGYSMNDAEPVPPAPKRQ